MSITELAKIYAEIRSRHEAASDVLKAIEKEWTEAETALLDAMVEEGTRSIKIDELGTFSMATTNYLSVTAANKETFYPYLKESGNGSLLKEEVNPRTLTAFLKGHLEELIRLQEQRGYDGVDARNKALEFLNKKGASYFTKKEIRLKK